MADAKNLADRAGIILDKGTGQIRLASRTLSNADLKAYLIEAQCDGADPRKLKEIADNYSLAKVKLDEAEGLMAQAHVDAMCITKEIGQSRSGRTGD